jgi:hypothetical protein
MRGEDDGPLFDLAQAGESIGLIHKSDALLLEIVGRVGVVDVHAKHLHRPFCLFSHSLGDPKSVYHAMAVATRRDLEDFHDLNRVYAAAPIPSLSPSKLAWKRRFGTSGTKGVLEPRRFDTSGTKGVIETTTRAE